MNNHKMRLAVLLITTITFLAACKTGKQPVRKEVKIDKNAITKRYGVNGVDTPGATFVKPAPPPPAHTINDSKKQLIAQLKPLWEKQVNFSTFSGKAKMHLQARGTNNEFTAHIRMIKDKVIWVNITAMGGVVNVARVLIRPDSVFMMSPLQRTANIMPTRDVNKIMPVPVNFDMLQNLIAGNVIEQKGNATDATDFGGSWTIQVDNPTLTQSATYNKTDSTMRTLQMLMKPDGNPAGQMQYGNYEVTDGRMFSTSRVINISNNGEPYYLDMNFNNVSFDQEVEVPFSIPKSYTIK